MTSAGPDLPHGRLPALVVIGVVRSAYTTRADTPVQSALNASGTAIVEVEARFAAALEGLDGFDYAWVITWLGAAGDPAPDDVPLRQVPFLLRRQPRQPREVGVLATRGPRRINPIGLSLVRIVDVGPSTLRFAGVDMIDGTPVVDIKPFVARFDRPDGDVRCGWFDTVDLPDGATPASLEPTV
jgi:tRNA-Thr(GGU) m(6)t(6)A37 methyltransferase TsaA